MYISKSPRTFEECVALSKLESRYYDSSHITPPEESFEIAKRFPWSEAVLLDDENEDRVIGFLDLFPVSHAFSDRLKSGSYNDCALTPEDLLDPETTPPGAYPLFLCCIVIDDAYRGQGALSLLFQHQLLVLHAFTSRGITFSEVITDNVTELGERFSLRLGFQKVCDTQFGSKIYAGSYESLERVVTLTESPSSLQFPAASRASTLNV